MAAPSDIVWGSKVQGNTDSRYGRIGIYITTTETDTTLTAKIQVWFSTKYSCKDGASINLKVDIGTNITAASTTVVTNLPINHPTATGSGWSTSNHTCLYTVSKTYTKTSSAKTYNVYAAFSGIDMLPSKTMYDNKTSTVHAVYTISYNANGGTGAPDSQIKQHGVDLLLSSTKPTRTGYSFNNWLSSAQNKVYQPGKYYGYDTSTTMKAQWVANTYTVTYNANATGVSNMPSNQTKTYGVALTLSSTKPTRTNYNFLGWAKSASATAPDYNAGGSYTTNSAVTLYAVWELAYTKPRITNFTVTRCVSDTDETVTDTGTYALVKFSWATDKTATSIKIEWESSTGSGSADITPSGTSGTVKQVVGDGTISSDATYTFTLTVKDGTDAAHTTSMPRTLSGASFTIDFLAGGKGVAFGKPAEKENTVESAWPLNISGAITSQSNIVSHGTIISQGGSVSVRNDTYPTVYFRTADNGAVTSIQTAVSSRRFGIYAYTQDEAGNNTGYYEAYRLPTPTVSTVDAPVTENKWYSILTTKNKTDLLNMVYPVNSIYISYSHTSPAELFGGTWTRIASRFLWGTTTSGTIGATGGAMDVTLTVDQIPAHTHDVHSRTVYSSSGSANGLTIQKYGNITENEAIYATGGGKSHTNMPPYVNVAIWRRTA